MRATVTALTAREEEEKKRREGVSRTAIIVHDSRCKEDGLRLNSATEKERRDERLVGERREESLAQSFPR